jgi:uncharacterized protein YunC (DUF1805 family)
MSSKLPTAESKEITTAAGVATGISHRWEGGQYCALLTRKGLVGCGIYDIGCADEFGFAFALAKGTPERPLVEPEDLLPAKIVRVSKSARDLGIVEGMTGQEALLRLLQAEGVSAVAGTASVR